MRKTIAKTIVLFVVLTLAACADQPEYGYIEDDYVLADEVEVEIETETEVEVDITAGTEEPEPQPTPQPLSWQIAYAALLLEYQDKPSPVEWLDSVYRLFLLYDIDKDGIPELLIFYMATGFNSESVYTYRDGEVVPIEGGFFIYYARAYANPNGAPGIVLANTLRHPAVPDAVYYELVVIDADRLVTETILTQAWEDWYQWWDGQEIPRESGWFINDRQVTEAEFEAAYHNIFHGWDENHSLWPHMITDENIKEIVFGWQGPPLVTIGAPAQQISLFVCK